MFAFTNPDSYILPAISLYLHHHQVVPHDNWEFTPWITTCNHDVNQKKNKYSNSFNTKVTKICLLKAYVASGCPQIPMKQFQ